MPIMHSSIIVLAVGLSVASLACDDGDEGPHDIDTPDASPDEPDSAQGPADAAHGAPDASANLPPDAGPPAPVSFKEDVLPILVWNCGTSCHVKDAPGSEMLAFGSTGQLAHGNIVDRKAKVGVCAGILDLIDTNTTDPNMSALYQRLSGTMCGNRMPKGGAALPASELDKIRAWIEAGAPNN